MQTCALVCMHQTNNLVLITTGLKLHREPFTDEVFICTYCCILFVFFLQIARLRDEGSRQLEEEQRLIKEQIQREKETQQQQTGDYTQRCTSISIYN